MLAVVFTELDAFRREFHENLLKGGIFVPTEQPVELRSRVEVGIDLQFCQKHIVLEGEVVHCLSPEMASAGAVPGVAVQVDKPIKELRDVFARLVGDIAEPAESAQPEPSQPKPQKERRGAARATARVLAQVRNLEGHQLEGMTRDLSTSGLQFSVTGEPLPIGERVIVVLTNPNSRESLEIPSQVMRHVEGDAGDVAALGIHFSPDEDCREQTRRFLRRLRNDEHTRRLGGISGDIEELGLANLLRSFASFTQEGTVTLINGSQEGYIAFRHGALVATSIGRVAGTKALARMLCWETGRFEFHARVDANLERAPEIRLEAALMDAMREIDKIRNAARTLFRPDAKFAQAQEVTGQSGCNLSKLESAILDLVSVGANVRKIMDVVPESDSRVQETLSSLVDLGILLPSGH